VSLKILTWLTTFLLIVICELGDKTQVAVLCITSNSPSRRWYVFIGSALALCLCVLIEVTVGVALAKIISPAIINRATGVVFLILGSVIVTQYFTGNLKRNKKIESQNKNTCEILKNSNQP
jgi:putative Ca2+/H+ antiporter (TMEM165/GDT1 family)